MTEKYIKELLAWTERPGIENLIAYMEENGFFTSPCSGSHHLAVEGGLAEHSLNVFKLIRSLKGAFYCFDNHPEAIGNDSLIIVSLLHDLGKMGDNGNPYYIPNYLKSGKISDSKPYTVNPLFSGIPHEVLSISIISKFIQLTNEEYKAILWHNGLYSDFKYEITGKETPLYMLLHYADLWSSRVWEVEHVKD